MQTDCVVVGAGFAGLACATALARAGFHVRVLEKKGEAGERLHTTGVLVKEVVEQIALLDPVPPTMLRSIAGVRLYSPKRQSVDLRAPGYFFLATDTRGLLNWMAAQAQAAGAEIRYQALFRQARRLQAGWEVDGWGRCRYLVGADGPKSRVAQALALGCNREFLFGMEYEYRGLQGALPDYLHCFIDRQLAPGYLAWVVPGVESLQVGLARRHHGRALAKQALSRFVAGLQPLLDLRGLVPSDVRAGFIPCGGLVNPTATSRALLVGDAAGMVSPLTAGGIHTALKHGSAAGHAIGEFLSGKSADPCGTFCTTYPRFLGKRVLRWLFDTLQNDWSVNLLLQSSLVRHLASQIFFHQRAKGSYPGNGDKPAGPL
jgi:geranylgeranyl reductase family protein